MGIVHDLRFPHARRRGPSAWMQWRRWLLGDSAASDRAALVDQPGVVGAYLVPASPLLVLRRHEPTYAELQAAMQRVAREIDELQPDTLVIYSTRWFAVLDQLWQGRARMAGLHVDENWHELGEVRFDMTTDVSLARACVRAAQRAGIASKLVDYAGFPIDSGTLTANVLADPDGTLPVLVVANNLYHDFDQDPHPWRAGRGAGGCPRQARGGAGGGRLVWQRVSRRPSISRRPDRQRNRRRLEPAHAEANRPRAMWMNCFASCPTSRRGQGRHGFQAFRLCARRTGRAGSARPRCTRTGRSTAAVRRSVRLL